MRLDMYAYTIKAELVEDQGDVDVQVIKTAIQPYQAKDSQMSTIDAENLAMEDGVFNPDFASWFNFHHLHGWMERLYVAKGGKKEFNCTTVRLDKSDLAALQQAIKEETLTHQPGFFFDGEEIHPEDLEELQDFIHQANQAIEYGFAVFYDSWQ